MGEREGAAHIVGATPGCSGWMSSVGATQVNVRRDWQPV